MKNNNFSLQIILFVFFVTFFSNWASADSVSANRQTLFNSFTDYAVTLGKNSADKKEIIKERQDLRRTARLMKEERKKKELMVAQMKAQEKIIMRKQNAQSY